MGTVIPLDRPRTTVPAPPSDAPAVYTVREVSRLLRLHLGGVYELLNNGTIPAERLGRRWIISRVRFPAWLDGTGEADH